MPYVLLTIVVLALVWLPSAWVRWVMRQHGRDRDDIPGTGSELAQHLIDRFELGAVAVEQADEKLGDHYDPTSSTVRLRPSNFSGRSLTAVAIAAHEVGHAIQFQRREPISRLRQRVLPMAMGLKRMGILLMYLIPFVGILVRSPAAIFAVVALSLGLQLLGALAYLIVLPEEWDASFNKAMPILLEGDYVADADVPAVRQLLKAAAMTYFCAALAEMLNLGRLLLILRR